MSSQGIYTIGYGSRTLEEFLKVLGRHGIQYLIDVRSRPYSRFKPEFSKQQIEHHLNQHHIKYLFLGDALGGLPDDPDCYVNGKVDYELLGKKPFYRSGISRLENASRQDLKVILMCSEGKPENCHRSKLIGRTLNGTGIEIIHIDENDIEISQSDVMLRLTGGQPPLFGEDFQKYTSRKKYETGEDSQSLIDEDDD